MVLLNFYSIYCGLPKARASVSCSSRTNTAVSFLASSCCSRKKSRNNWTCKGFAFECNRSIPRNSLLVEHNLIVIVELSSYNRYFLHKWYKIKSNSLVFLNPLFHARLKNHIFEAFFGESPRNYLNHFLVKK